MKSSSLTSLTVTLLVLLNVTLQLAHSLPTLTNVGDEYETSKPFQGFRVLEATPNSEDQLSLLREIESNLSLIHI